MDEKNLDPVETVTPRGAQEALTGSGTVTQAAAGPPRSSSPPPGPAGGGGSRPPSHHLETGARLGTCEVVRVLGEGGMGVIYEGRDLGLGRRVAIKTLSNRLASDPKLVERFRREARSMAQLTSHPGIVQVFSAGREDEPPHFVMEFIEGESLEDRLRRGPLDVNEAVRIVRTIAEVLETAHCSGILHRDIKPSNIMLTAAGAVKVLDFGLAKIRDDLQGTGPLTQAQEIMGTPLYMSPEQATGKPVDHRSDLYGLGATFHHLLVGRPPFEDTSLMGILHKHATEPLPPLAASAPHVPPALASIVERMLHKDPGQRYQRFQDLCDELDRLAPANALVPTATVEPRPAGAQGWPAPLQDLRMLRRQQRFPEDLILVRSYGREVLWIGGFMASQWLVFLLVGNLVNPVEFILGHLGLMGIFAGLNTGLSRTLGTPIRFRTLVHLEAVLIPLTPLAGVLGHLGWGGKLLALITLMLTLRYRYLAMRDLAGGSRWRAVSLSFLGWVFTLSMIRPG